MRYLDIHTHQPPSATAIPTLAIRSFDLAQSQAYHAYEGYSSLGLHPWHLTPHWPQLMPSLAQQLSHKQVLMLGEAGLDRLRGPELPIQLAAFEAQAQLAHQLQKPIIIHLVRASEEIKRLYDHLNTNIPWVIHGYHKKFDLALELLSRGFYLSFGAHLLRPDSAAAACFERLPPDRLLLETDDSAHSIADIYQRAATLQAMSLPDWAAQQEQNWERLFGYRIPMG